MQPEYRLPFPAGVKYEQRTFREDEFDLDVPILDPQNGVYFGLPENTPIMATRSGKVIESLESVVDCGDLNKVHQTNMVVVDEGQGRLSLYVHLKPTVRNGTKIDQGQDLGQLYGHCFEPHFHYYAVKVENNDQLRALPVNFSSPAPK